MRIITYNLHKGRGPRNTNILEDVAAALRERAPDILMCQEVFHGAADSLHQSQFLTEVLGHPHVFGPNAFYRRGCHGNATLARYSIAHHHNVDITMSRLEKRGMLRTRLDVDGHEVDVFNVHFSLTARQRRAQWLKLMESLPTDPAVRVLVCGDFNDWSDAIDRAARRAGVLTNALWQIPWRERATFPAGRPVFRLDRAYVRGLTVRSVRVLRDAPWPWLSDHLPVEIELAV